MNLPKNLTIMPGVMTDHKGRSFRYARYPSGKTVEVPYEASDAPPARTIPIPQEPKPERLQKTLREVGSGKPIRFTPRRMMHLEFRETRTQQRHKLELPNAEGQAYVDDQLRPLMRFDGKRWHAIETPNADWMVQSHFDSKEPQDATQG